MVKVCILFQATIVLLVAFLELACAPDVHGLARPVATTCADANPDDLFFRGVFSHKDERGEADVQGVSRLLLELGESSISCKRGTEEVFRVVYMPEGRKALLIKAEHVASDYTITVASQGAEVGSPSRTSRPLSGSDWNALARAIDEYGFWSRPPYPTPTTINHKTIIVHGPAWLLEGRQNGWYHAVSRVSASKEPGFDVPARTMFEIAGLEVPGAVKPRP